MNPQIAKEIRQIRTPFVWAVGLSLAALAGQGLALEELRTLVAAIGHVGGLIMIAVMAAAVFGLEFEQGTLQLQLAQPRRRRDLWWRKHAVLAAALLPIFALPFLVPGRNQDAAVVFMLAPVVALCAGPFWSLIARSTLGGAAFLLAATVMVLMIGLSAIGYVWLRVMGRPLEDGQPVAIAICLVYALVMCRLGWKWFLRMPIAESAGNRESPGQLLWSLMRVLPSPSTGHRNRAFLNLLRKEVHLQQTSLLIAGLFAVVWVLAMVSKWLRPELDAVVFVVALGIYLPLMPILIGALAAAEERSLGIHAWHLTLPPSMRNQWGAKVMSTLCCSLLLGLGVPLIAVLISSTTGSFIDGIPNPGTAAILCLLNLLVVTVAIYVGTLARNTVGSALGALAGLGVLFVFFYLGEKLFQLFIKRAPPHSMGILTLAAAGILLANLLWLGGRNFRRAALIPRDGRNQVVRLVGSWAAAVVLVLGGIPSLILAWNALTPEPRPGPALARKSGATPRVRSIADGVVVLAPNGVLWKVGSWQGGREGSIDWSKPPVRLSPDDDWVEMAAGNLSTLAIKSDGTMWAWGSQPMPDESGNARWVPLPEQPSQVGNDRDWRSVAAWNLHFVALKRDGSLWTWGSQIRAVDDKTRSLPKREEGGSDWALIAEDVNATFGAKRDGSVWVWGEPQWHAQPNRKAIGPSWRSLYAGNGTQWASLEVTPFGLTAIQPNGEVWYAGLLLIEDGHYIFGSPQLTRLDLKPDWSAAAIGEGQNVALKRDGTIWRWSFSRETPSQRYTAQLRSARRVGQRSDWMTVTTQGGIVWGLTADGGLWVFDRLPGSEEKAFRLKNPRGERHRKVCQLGSP